MSVFLPSSDLGILEMRLQESLTEKVKRKRQIAFRSSIMMLKMLKLIDEKAKPIGLAEGFNYLGEKGFWIVLEAQREVIEGPQVNWKTIPHRFEGELVGDPCKRCGSAFLDYIHEVPHG